MTQWGVDTLFNPAKRHMDDEKRRLQSTREEVGDASGGKRIDLNSGKVVIHRSTDDPAEDDGTAAGEDAAGDAAAGEDAAGDAAAGEDAAGDAAAAKNGGRTKRSGGDEPARPDGPSPAALRAARRRARSGN